MARYYRDKQGRMRRTNSYSGEEAAVIIACQLAWGLIKFTAICVWYLLAGLFWYGPKAAWKAGAWTVARARRRKS